MGVLGSEQTSRDRSNRAHICKEDTWKSQQLKVVEMSHAHRIDAPPSIWNGLKEDENNKTPENLFPNLPGTFFFSMSERSFSCVLDPEDERYNYLSSNQLQLLQRLLQRQKQWELDSAIQRSKLFRESKRGPGGCINKCLSGSGMSFVRCKSMCHW